MSLSERSERKENGDLVLNLVFDSSLYRDMSFDFMLSIRLIALY